MNADNLYCTSAKAERDHIIRWLRDLNAGDHSHNHWTCIARRIEEGDHIRHGMFSADAP